MPQNGSSLGLRWDPARRIAWRRPLRAWHLGAFAAVALILLPLGAVAAGGLAAGVSPLALRLFADRLLDTLVVAAPITVSTVLLGSTSAWLLFRYEVPGSRILSFLLMLPLTVPAYIAAAVYVGVFGPGGIPYEGLRLLVGWIPSPYPTPSFGGPAAVWFVMTVVLFPYVYALSKSAYSTTLVPLLESAESLGVRKGLFLKFALPIARPAVVAGGALVLMEVLNEYGTMVYLGHSTLTTGIFRAWFLHGDVPAARSLAFGVLLLVLLVQSAERRFRGSGRFASLVPGSAYRRRRLSPGPRWLAAAYLWSLGALGFLIPVGGVVTVLLRGVRRGHLDFGLAAAGTTVLVALVSTAIAVVLALFVAYARRLVNRHALSSAVSLSTIGYAVPGAVIALGVLTLGSFLGTLSGGALLITSSFAALLIAYQVRFFAVAYGPTDSALRQVHAGMGESARTLGSSPGASLLRIEAPLIKRSLLAAALLFFVDVVKELPLTLILRPFNTGTLAIRTFELATSERLVEASVPALLLILLSTIPSIAAFKLLGRKENRL